MDKKYELVNKREDGLYQIRALRSFSNVKAGDLGGFIQRESNLSHEGNCWVYNRAEVFDSAQVYDNARVFTMARVFNNAQVFHSALVYGKAQVLGDARVFNNAQVFDSAEVFNMARVYDKAQVFNTAQVYNKAWVFGKARVLEETRVYGEARVSGEAFVCGKAQVFGRAQVHEKAQVFGNAQVFNNAQVYGKAQVLGEARVFDEAEVYGNAKICDNRLIYGHLKIFDYPPVETSIDPFNNPRHDLTKTIKSTKICYMDIDNTLVFSKTERPELKDKNMPEVKINNVWWYIHIPHVNIIKDFKGRGHTVVLWSAGGAEWAETVARALNVYDIVDLIISKPDYLFDDKPVTFWITPNMVYFKEP